MAWSVVAHRVSFERFRSGGRVAYRRLSGVLSTHALEFVVIRDPHSIEVRTYERGVEAETLSCGSGVIASVSMSALFDKVTSPVKVLTRSGITFEVFFAREGSEVRDVRIKGDARVVYRGSMTAETIDGFDPAFFKKPSEPALSA